MFLETWRMSCVGLQYSTNRSSASTAGGLSGTSWSPSESSASKSTVRPPAVIVLAIAVTHAQDHGHVRYAS